MTTYEDIKPQLIWVCNALIPADAELEMPSAVEAGVVTTLLPRALKARPDLAPAFIELIGDLPSEEPNKPLEALNALGKDHFEHVAHFIAGAFFLSTEVNERLKYPGQQAMPHDPDYDEIFEIIDRVHERGPVYVAP